MKVKTSITLSEDVLKAVDKMAGEPGQRSEFIEMVLRGYIAEVGRTKRNIRDLEIINRRAARLNREAEDVLGYQSDV